MLFCDTSTLAKYYVPEPESGAVARASTPRIRWFFPSWHGPRSWTSFTDSYASASGPRHEFLAVVRQFSTDEVGGYWTWVPLDSGIVEQVVRTYGTLPEDVFLRTADCLHIVTALRHGFTEIHTHDTHQRNGAGALGLTAVTIE